MAPMVDYGANTTPAAGQAYRYTPTLTRLRWGAATEAAAAAGAVNQAGSGGVRQSDGVCSLISPAGVYTSPICLIAALSIDCPNGRRRGAC